MRPPIARESRAVGAHLQGEGGERPGVGPRLVCGRHRTCAPAIREIVVGFRCGDSRVRDLPSASWSCTSRMVMDRASSTRGKRVFVQLLSPLAPHLAEELCDQLGEPFSVHESAWPAADRVVLENQQLTVVVQLDGRVVGRFSWTTGQQRPRS